MNNDDSDLHTSNNPYAQGLPARGTAHPTDDGFMTSPLGYWTPPRIDANNPFSAGDGTGPNMDESTSQPKLSAYASNKFGNDMDAASAAYDRSEADAYPPNTSAYDVSDYVDAGQSDQLVPPDQRR